MGGTLKTPDLHEVEEEAGDDNVRHDEAEEGDDEQAEEEATLQVRGHLDAFNSFSACF